MARTPKGEVSIEGVGGWLRLRWRYQGKRRVLALGLRDDPVNRTVASQRVAQIRLDTLSGNFDETLEKYKGDRIPQQGKDLGAVALFERFTEKKSHQVQRRSLEKYHGLLTWLRDFFSDRPATEADAPPFIAWLGENLEPITARERLGLLKAAWRWGVDQGWVSENPWEDHVIRKPPKQKAKAFTKAEVEAILRGFAESRYYRHYVDYVRFKFGTGFRTGEVNALRWRHFKIVRQQRVGLFGYKRKRLGVGLHQIGNGCPALYGFPLGGNGCIGAVTHHDSIAGVKAAKGLHLRHHPIPIPAMGDAVIRIV